MNETLLRLCCKEFETFEEVCKANPYGLGDTSIQYPLPNYTSRYSIGQTMSGHDQTSMIGVLEIGRMNSGRFAWVPRVTQEAQLVEAVKKLIREESEKAIANFREVTEIKNKTLRLLKMMKDDQAQSESQINGDRENG